MKKRKVRIIAMPKAGSGLEVKVNSGMGFNSRQMNWPLQAGEYAAPAIEVKKTISGDLNPNIEAEGGETIVDDRDKDGIAEHYRIQGPRHTNGGVDIKAGENSFVFSDTKAMKIKGDVLKTFNKSPKKAITPADIVKQYDLNEYLGILKDPDTDDIQRRTAEMMIANYNKKLGGVALLQESKKGFDAGIPVIAHDYLESIGMNPAMFTQNLGQSEQPDANMARYGGSFPKAQTGNQGDATLQAKQKELSTAISNAELRNKVAAWNTPETPSIWQNAKYDILTAMRPIAEKLFFPDDFDHSHKIASNAYDEELRRITAPPQSAEDYFGSSVNFGSMPANTQANPKELQDAYDKKVKEKKAFDSYYNNLALSLKPKLPSRHYSSKEEYQADLLSPYSPEKRAAQMEWLAKQKKTSASSPMPGVSASQVNPGALTDVIINPADTAGLSAQPWQKFGGEQELKKYWLGGPNGEGRKKVQDSGPQKGYTIYEDGSEQDPSGKWTKNATVPKPGSNTAKAGQGSGSGVNQGNWQKEPLIPYQMTEAYGPKGAKLLSAYLPEYGINLPENATEQDIKNAVDQMQQKAISTHPELVKDYLLNRSHKPNKALLDKLPAGYKSQEGLKKAIAEGKISNEDLLSSYNDKQWWYRALGTKANKLTKAEYDKRMAMPGAIKEGDKLYWNNPETPWRYDYYTAEEDAPRDPGARVDDRPKADYKPTVNAFVPGEKRDVPNEYWKQDIMRQHGNVRDYLTLENYPPWQATPNVHLAEAVFEDPNRGIAAMQEGVNAQNQLMGTFAGPQGLARSQASARGANSMADYIAGVANRNIDRANQLDIYNTGVLNQGAMTSAGLATQLYDKNTIRDQQFDNSRRQILHNMDDTAINAETNRAYTHNLNQINPHYNIRPSLGGDMAWTGQADPFAPVYEDPDAWLKQYTDYRGKLPATVTDDAIIKLLSASKQKNIGNPYAAMANAGMYPGGQQGFDPSNPYG